MDEATRKRIAAEHFKKGNDAAAQENWEYAVELHGQAVNLYPDNLGFRQALRFAECRMYNDNKKGARLGVLKIKPLQMKISGLRRKEKWREVDQAAEEGLKVNPWDAQLNYDMADACNHLGFKDCARFGFKVAVEQDPKSLGYLKALAILLEEKGEYSEAMGCWKRVRTLDPEDREARSKLSQLDASWVIDRGGYEKADKIQQVMTGYDFDQPGKGQSHDSVAPGESVEADLKHAIRKEPANKELYLKLADFYRRERRLDDVAAALEQAMQVSGDMGIREQLEEAQLQLLRRDLELAKQAAAHNPEDQNARKNIAALANELLTREIEVLTGRVARYPKDTRNKLDLAKLFMRRKNWSEAIKLLQQARADDRLKVEVAVCLGECFLYDNKRALAFRQFEEAVAAASPHDQPDLFKKAHYTLGRLHEEEKRFQDAERHYNEVLAVDYDYKDTLKRMESLQSGPGTQGLGE